MRIPNWLRFTPVELCILQKEHIMNNNDTAPANSKRVAVANKIKRVRTPLIIATAAIGVGVAVKWEMDSRAVLVWHQQRIDESIEAGASCSMTLAPCKPESQG